MEKFKWIKILWLVAALYFAFRSVYSTYYVAPEAAIGFVMLLTVISFPAGFLVGAVGSVAIHVFDVQLNMLGNIVLHLMMVASGYFQWRFIFPNAWGRNN